MKLYEGEWPKLPTQGFVLLEPSNRPHFIDDGSFIGKPCVPFGMEKIEHLMPQLIDLQTISEADGELLQDLCATELAQNRPPYVNAWISSERSSEDLAALVAAPLVGSSGGLRLIWRYYDPRVLSLAFNVLASNQYEALFHGIQRWVMPWSGHWWKTDGTQDRSRGFDRADQAWPSPDQWTTFSNSQLIHRVHTEICARRVLEPKTLPATQQAIVIGMREAATRFRLGEPVQQAEYARLLVLFGEAFKHHRLLEGSREKLANGQMNWPEFRALVDEDELERLTH